MSSPRAAEFLPSNQPPRRAPTEGERAFYTYDMLISLKKMAWEQNQEQLAVLIDAAVREARTIIRQEMERSAS